MSRLFDQVTVAMASIDSRDILYFFDSELRRRCELDPSFQRAEKIRRINLWLTTLKKDEFDTVYETIHTLSQSPIDKNNEISQKKKENNALQVLLAKDDTSLSRIKES